MGFIDKRINAVIEDVKHVFSSSKYISKETNTMSFATFMKDTDEILNVVGAAFNTVETAVGEGVAPVTAIGKVAIALAGTYPPTAPYVAVGIDITSEIESIITAIRGIKAKKS